MPQPFQPPALQTGYLHLGDPQHPCRPLLGHPVEVAELDRQPLPLRQAGNDVFKAYRKEYKRRFAWIKAGRISDEDFYAWSEQARAQKKECDEGTIALEDFQRWLKES